MRLTRDQALQQLRASMAKLPMVIFLFVTVVVVCDVKAADSPLTKTFVYKKTKQADLEIVVHYPPG